MHPNIQNHLKMLNYYEIEELIELVSNSSLILSNTN